MSGPLPHRFRARTDSTTWMSTYVAAICLLLGTRVLVDLAGSVLRNGAYQLPYFINRKLASIPRKRSLSDKAGQGISETVTLLNPPIQTIDGVLQLGCMEVIRAAAATEEARRLSVFLLVNVAFMILEAAVGLLSGSLTLTTDAAHMLLDCSSLAVGLYGETLVQRPALSCFPFGFARYAQCCCNCMALPVLLPNRLLC